MRWPTLVIVALVVLVLTPMWIVAIQGEAPTEEVEIDRSVSEIRPLDGFVDTPNKLSPSQVGVIVWVALFVLFGVLAAVHRFMNAAVRPPDHGAVGTDEEAATTDGGVSAPSWMSTGDRWVVEYHPSSASVEGLVAMGGLTVLAIIFAALFTAEYFTLARTQYFGVYAAGMFLSLTGLTAAYYAWFMPHVEVAEQRRHS